MPLAEGGAEAPPCSSRTLRGRHWGPAAEAEGRRGAGSRARGRGRWGGKVLQRRRATMEEQGGVVAARAARLGGRRPPRRRRATAEGWGEVLAKARGVA